MVDRTKITLIESKSKNPKVDLKLNAGMSVELVDILPAQDIKKVKTGRAALCGYGNACLAIIDVGEIKGEC